MVEFLIKLLLVARSKLKSRARLEAENIVLRQQVIVLSRKARSRVRLRNIDRLILVWMYRLFPPILNAITVIKPKTVIRWHRRGFRAYWRWQSRQHGGRPKIDREIRDLIAATHRPRSKLRKTLTQRSKVKVEIGPCLPKTRTAETPFDYEHISPNLNSKRSPRLENARWCAL
jgi:hypothetical protein